MSLNIKSSMSKNTNFEFELILCIDGTGSMEEIIDNVKANANNLASKITTNLNNATIKINSLRVKVIVFKNFECDGKNALTSSPFFDLDQQETEFLNFLNTIKADGGGEDPLEDGLEALAIAITSNWNFKENSFQIIVLWTDNGSHRLEDNYKKGFPHYPKSIPNSFNELMKAWEGTFLSKTKASKLVLYAPNQYPWKNINSEWTNVSRYDLDNDNSNSSNSEEITNDIINQINDLFEKKQIEEDPKNQAFISSLIIEKDRLRKLLKKAKPKNELPNSHNTPDSTIESKKDSLLKQILKAVTFISIAVVSIRFIGFSIFSYQYTNIENQTNNYYIESKEKLDSLVGKLKKEKRISKNTIIEIKTNLKKESNLIADQANLNVQLFFEYDVSNFKLGQYSVQEYRETKEACKILIDYLNKLNERYKEYSSIEVKVTGETDNTPITGEILYNGEFGILKYKKYTFNNFETIFGLTERDLIQTNEKLGFLRGYSFWYNIKSRTDLFITSATKYQQFVKINPQKGSFYRRTTINIKINDVDTRK